MSDLLYRDVTLSDLQSALERLIEPGDLRTLRLEDLGVRVEDEEESHSSEAGEDEEDWDEEYDLSKGWYDNDWGEFHPYVPSVYRLVERLVPETNRLVSCSVWSGMFSGNWGVSWFQLGNRGYIVPEPDLENDSSESLTLYCWAPVEDFRAFSRIFRTMYWCEWSVIGLPPFRGEFASWGAPVTDALMIEAIRDVLREPNGWGQAKDTLRCDARRALEVFSIESLAAEVGLNSPAAERLLDNMKAGDSAPPLSWYQALEDSEQRFIARLLLACF